MLPNDPLHEVGEDVKVKPTNLGYIVIILVLILLAGVGVAVSVTVKVIV